MALLPIEEQVINEATRQSNGRWIFEGKDTHSWFGLAEHQRHAAERLGPQYREYADESYIISSRLQALDNNER